MPRDVPSTALRPLHGTAGLSATWRRLSSLSPIKPDQALPVQFLALIIEGKYCIIQNNEKLETAMRIWSKDGIISNL